jgi:hypothetical protein
MKNVGIAPNLPSIFTITAAALGLLVIIVMLAYTGYGYDVTDEGFYLVRIADPFADAPAVSQFGIVFYPFYKLLDGSIAGLRQFNLLLTFSSSTLLCMVTIRKHRKDITRTTLFLISLGIASTSCAVFASFLLTPNYNSLALQGLVIATMGLVLIEPQARYSSVAGWLLTSCGGWLVFLAKPPSAFLLAAFALIYLIASRKLRFSLLVFATIFTALLALGTMYAVDGFTSGFISRIQRGMERLAWLEDRTVSQIIRWDPFALNDTEALLTYGFAAWTFSGLCLIASANMFARAAGRAFVATAGIAAALVLLGNIAMPDELNIISSQQTIVYGPLLGLSIFLFLHWIARGCSITQQRRIHQPLAPEARQWPLVVLLILLPFIFSFGTNSNYWYTSPPAGLFWTIAGSILLLHGWDRTQQAEMLASWATFVQLPIAFLVAAGLHWPYRQPQPVPSFDAATEFGVGKARLVIPKGFAAYLEELRGVLGPHGFASGTPVIDLTGQSPGVLFAIGAKNIGQPWMIGGYPGSTKVALMALSHESCVALGSSWILAEPGGPRSISTDVLQASGLPFPRSYKIVGEILVPTAASGHPVSRRQIIYSPTMSPAEITSSCESYRS